MSEPIISVANEPQATIMVPYSCDAIVNSRKCRNDASFETEQGHLLCSTHAAIWKKPGGQDQMSFGMIFGKSYQDGVFQHARDSILKNMDEGYVEGIESKQQADLLDIIDENPKVILNPHTKSANL
jgi:hypothetical protein